MLNMKKRGLGKNFSELGLSELLSDLQTPKAGEINSSATSNAEQRKLSIELMQPGKYQPRKDIDPEALQELADSIRSQGVIQPIVVRPIAAHQYEIIAGERRWRASQLAGLTEVPVVIRDIPDEAAIAMALIENIQREDLNAIETAVALERLAQEFDLTHQEVSEIVGKSRTTVTNLLRLLSLNEDVKRLLAHGDIEMGHARALLSLTGLQQTQAAQTVVAKAMSVRETEKLVQRLQQQSGVQPKSSGRIDPDVLRLQTDLSDKLGAAVTIKHNNNKGHGQLVIAYNTVDELEGILEHIK